MPSPEGVGLQYTDLGGHVQSTATIQTLWTLVSWGQAEHIFLLPQPFSGCRLPPYMGPQEINGACPLSPVFLGGVRRTDRQCEVVKEASL